MNFNPFVATKITGLIYPNCFLNCEKKIVICSKLFKICRNPEFIVVNDLFNKQKESQMITRCQEVRELKLAIDIQGYQLLSATNHSSRIYFDY